VFRWGKRKFVFIWDKKEKIDPKVENYTFGKNPCSGWNGGPTAVKNANGRQSYAVEKQ